MKKVTLSILTIALSATVWAQSADRSVKPKPGPAPEVKIGASENFTLPNGMRVFVVEKHKLPTISCSIQLDIKPELEKDMTGFHSMMSDLLVTGTTTRSKEKLNEEIDFMGARIGAYSQGIYGGGLKKYQEKIFELMSDIAMNADFKQEELDKLKKLTLSGMETEKNEPDAMLKNVSNVVNYGAQHPYGEVATEETVNNITLEKCRSYYKTYFRPNVAYVAIVGDITLKEAKGLMEKYFGKWEKADVPVAQYSTPEAPAGPRVAFTPRDAAVQSVINVTYPVDLQIGTPDVIKARVANSILGGGSQGRLFLNLREQHAWTYGSYSDINDDDLMGSFSASAKCRNAVSDSAVAEILNEMNRMRNEKVSMQDVQDNITYMSGNFAIGLEDPSRIAQYAINIERYKMPKDYYQNYLKNLAAVTPEDVQAIAQKYIKPENANIVVVGSKKDVAPKLAKFGPVSYYDNYGRPIQETVKAAVPAGLSADDVLKNYIKAIGGREAIEKVKDIKTVASSQIQGIDLTITEVKKMPNKMKAVVEGSMQGQKMVLQKQVFDGKKGHQEQQGQKAPMGPEDVEEAKREADIAADLHPEKYGITRKLTGVETINGADAYVVEATNTKGKILTEYYDVKSAYLVKKVQVIETPGGPMTQTVEYSDYKEVPGSNGYKVPYTMKQSGGSQTLTATLQSVEVNKSIPDTDFQ